MRAEKTSLVDEIKRRIEKSPFVIATDYAGMSVPQFTELRNRLRPVGARFTVVKNTVLRTAAKDLGLPAMDSWLNGQTAVVSGEQDVAAAAKILKKFSAECSKPVIRGAVLDGAILEKSQLLALADLPSREVLLAQLLGLLNTPATRLARVLSEPGASLARVLQARVDKGE
jgi:large subunit ribosomal protein L10